MRERKLALTANEQSQPRSIVKNPTNLKANKTQADHKKILTEEDFRFDPSLIAAILKRSPEGIKACINPNPDHKEKCETLSADQHKIFKNYYGDIIYANPIKLALKMCDNETLEATHVNEPTRFDVLHCLAANWDDLIESSRQRGHLVPDLTDVLKYACKLSSHIPLHTFILGLSEERKEEAAEILNAKVVL